MPEVKIKIVTYNIQNGAHPKSILKRIGALAKSGVELFALQEARPMKRKVFIGDRIMALLGPEWQSEFFVSPRRGSWDLGTGIVWKTTRFTKVDVVRIALPKPHKLSRFERVVVKTLAHQSEASLRAALVITLSIGGDLIRFANIHLDWQGGMTHRLGQLAHALSQLAQMKKCDHEVVLGDFNTIGTSKMYYSNQNRLEQAFGNSYCNCMPELNVTTRGVLKQKLDYIFVRNLIVLNSKVLRVRGSDHHPLLAELSLG